MKAFVINEDQIKTAGLGLVAVIVAAFIAGYFLGSMQRGPANENNQALTSGALNPSSSKQVETQKNSKEDIKDNSADKNKTDKKQAKVEAKKKADKKKADKKKADKKKQVKKVTTAEKKAAKKSVADKKPVNKKETKDAVSNKKSTENNKSSDIKSRDTKQSLSANTSAQALTANKTLTANDRIYSIQAGMFSSETNANSFIEKLSVKKFDAYISSFVSSSGATKYNVRVGKFAQRDQARELLREFQKSFSSPAYVVISQP